MIDLYLMGVYVDDKLTYTICDSPNNEEQMRKAILQAIVTR